jgi:hypothetical protein
MAVLWIEDAAFDSRDLMSDRHDDGDNFIIRHNMCLGSQNDATMNFLIEMYKFSKIRKKFWLAPVIPALLMIGLLVVFTGSSAIAPFINTLF